MENRTPPEILVCLYESNMIEQEPSGLALLDAYKAWDYIRGQTTLSIPTILETHRLLMVHRRIDRVELGCFRQRAVYIGNSEGAPWETIHANMQAWCELANSATAEAQFINDHIHYEAIHPFIDGNGRTGRMFLNWQRLRQGLDPLIIWESEKHDYYRWFYDKNL